MSESIPRLKRSLARSPPGLADERAVITITNLNPEDKAREPHRKGSNRFEELLEAPFPQAAREFAEQTVDQTREAYERSGKTLDAAVLSLAKSFDAAVHSAAAQRRNIIDIAQKNLNSGFDLAKSLAGASNLAEIVELQAAYWRKQFDAFITQAEEARRRLLEFGAAKPQTVETSIESIPNKTAKKTPPPAQEAPKKEHGPAARDLAAEGQRRDTQEPPAAVGSIVRPPAETRPGIRTGAPEHEPKRRQRPSPRGSTAEGGQQKPEPRPHSGLVARPEVRPAAERQSGTRKKAAQDEALQQSLPTEIKFAMLDGNAVRFTSLEAWWLVDGVWRPISPDEVLLNAAVMREARFNQLFPQVPRLPSNAFTGGL
jgi:hypothetical protein